MVESSLKGLKTQWEKKKLLIMSNFYFSHSVFKSCTADMYKHRIFLGKGLKAMSPFLRLIQKLSSVGFVQKWVKHSTDNIDNVDSQSTSMFLKM